MTVTTEELEVFTDRCFGIGSKIVAVVVKEWLPTIGDERIVRGALGCALMSVAVSQLRKIGMTREQIHEDVDERWHDWDDIEPAAPSGGSADDR